MQDVLLVIAEQFLAAYGAAALETGSEVVRVDTARLQESIRLSDTTITNSEISFDVLMGGITVREVDVNYAIFLEARTGNISEVRDAIAQRLSNL
jgi:hypothetical protein